MTTTPAGFEAIPRVAVAGVRFLDLATGSDLIHGLHVTLETLSAAPRALEAVRGPSGIYSFHDVPGLRDFENGAAGDADWSPPPSVRAYRLRVEDPDARCLPFWFDALLPCPKNDAFVHVAGEPLVPLFPSPARPVPAALACLRAELWEESLARPAAWAILEVRRQGAGAGPPTGRGLADGRGCVSVMFPWPEPELPPLGSPMDSPPAGSGVALEEQVWSFELRVRYESPAAGAAVPETADLAASLAQPEARLWMDAERTQPLGSVVLGFGRTLVVRSTRNGRSDSRLVVST